MLSGLYLNELMIRLLPVVGDAHPHLFHRYERTLQVLNSLCVSLFDEAEGGGEVTSASVEIALRRFEITLLAELGFGLAFGLDREWWCNPP